MESSDMQVKIKCRPCGIKFKDNNELKVHRWKEHPTHRPCKNFVEGNCDYGKRCGFNHVKIKETESICWTCGKIFTSRPDLMLHRKEQHPETLQTCNKLKYEGHCSRSNQECWNLHDVEEHDTNNHINNEQDFYHLQRNKRPPITEAKKNTETNSMMEELINLMKQFISKC